VLKEKKHGKRKGSSCQREDPLVGHAILGEAKEETGGGGKERDHTVKNEEWETSGNSESYTGRRICGWEMNGRKMKDTHALGRSDINRNL